MTATNEDYKPLTFRQWHRLDAYLKTVEHYFTYGKFSDEVKIVLEVVSVPVMNDIRSIRTEIGDEHDPYKAVSATYLADKFTSLSVMGKAIMEDCEKALEFLGVEEPPTVPFLMQFATEEDNV